MKADNYVTALASYTPLVFKTVGVRVPIHPVKGVIITVSGEPWADRPKMPIADDGRIFGLVPLADRLRVSGSAAVAAYDTTRQAGRAAGRSSTMLSASSPISPNATTRDREVLGRRQAGDADRHADPRLLNLYIAAGYGLRVPVHRKTFPGPSFTVNRPSRASLPVS